METELRPGQDHAGESCADLDGAWPGCILADAGLAMARWGGPDPRAMALPALHHHAGEQRARSDGARAGRAGDAAPDRTLGIASCRAQRARMRGDARLSVG